MDWVQSKPGGQLCGSNARHSKLGPHSEVDVQGWKAAQRPKVALVQYWPAGQSARVWHCAAVHSPSEQINPAAPQDTSLMQRRKQVPCVHWYSAVASRGSNPGAQSVANAQGGMHSPWVTSQR